MRGWLGRGSGVEGLLGFMALSRDGGERGGVRLGRGWGSSWESRICCGFCKRLPRGSGRERCREEVRTDEAKQRKLRRRGNAAAFERLGRKQSPLRDVKGSEAAAGFEKKEEEGCTRFDRGEGEGGEVDSRIPALKPS